MGNRFTELVQELLDKKGYFNNGKFKKGKVWLANRYKVSVEDMEDVMENAKRIHAKANRTVVLKKIATAWAEEKAVKVSKPDIQTYWITGCTHAPFHNKEMYESTLKYLRENVQLTGIILAGDILDLNSLSFHDKGKVPLKDVTLAWEYRGANKFLNQIQSLIQEQDIKDLHFMYGNHEDRYNRTMKQIDSSKLGKSLISPEKALRLRSRGYKVYTDFQRDSIQLGDLHVNHGEFLNVHVAKKTLDVYKQSSLFFHTHRFQTFAEGRYVGYNMGFGGDLNSPIFNYAPKGQKMQWVNASALVSVINGVAHVQPLMFVDGKLIVNGKVY